MGKTALWREKYAGKVKTAENAVKLVGAGQRVFIGTGCATPRVLVSALEARMPWPADVELLHFLTTGAVSMDENGKPVTRYRHRSFFVGTDVRELVKDGSTLQVGLGRIPNEAMRYLAGRKDLGVHSDVFTDAVLDLLEAGAIIGACKNDKAHRIVASRTCTSVSSAA